MEKEHFDELRNAHMRLREQDHKVYQLRDHIQGQAESMAKLQDEIGKMIIESKKPSNNKYQINRFQNLQMMQPNNLNAQVANLKQEVE